MIRKLQFASMLLVSAFTLGTAAKADVIFTLGNHPQPDEVNILLGSGATGMTVTGTPNGFPALTVDFTSDQVELEPSSGQARVSGNPDGTPLDDITISLASGKTYGDLIINPFLGETNTKACQMTSCNATVTVLAVDSHGNAEAPKTFTYTLGNGNNFLTITTANGERIVSTQIDFASGFDDLRQPRISGLTPVPEPGTYAPLMALGFGLVALVRKYRKA